MIYLYYVDIVRYNHIGQWYTSNAVTQTKVNHTHHDTHSGHHNKRNKFTLSFTLILKRRFESAITYSYRLLYFSKSLSLTILLL